MVSLEGFDRQSAIDCGVLIDVTDSIAEGLDLPCPVAISAALWHHPEVRGDPRHLQFIVKFGVTCPEWLVGLHVGEFSSGEFPCSVVLINKKKTYAADVSMQVIFEPSAEHGVVATLLEKGEVFDLRCPRLGSFYPM